MHLRTISPKGEWLHAVAEDNTLSFRSNGTFEAEWLREFANSHRFTRVTDVPFMFQLQQLWLYLFILYIYYICNICSIILPLLMIPLMPRSCFWWVSRYCFSVASGGLEQTLKVAEKEAAKSNRNTKQCHMKSKDVRRCHIMSLCNYLCSEVETCWFRMSPDA